jgi:hypothetical protein
MTKLLTKAFEKASKLPDIQQNALAKWVLEELESERKWESMFAGSEDVLDRLAEEALAAYRQGKTNIFHSYHKELPGCRYSAR